MFINSFVDPIRNLDYDEKYLEFKKSDVGEKYMIAYQDNVRSIDHIKSNSTENDTANIQQNNSH